MRIGIAGLGVSDTSALNDGSLISFTVEASPLCSGITVEDIRDTIMAWAGSMLHIDSVDSSNWNLIPFYTNRFSATATVTGNHSAGSIRSQIQSALASVSSRCGGNVTLENGTLLVSGDPGAPGGGSYSADAQTRCQQVGGKWENGVCKEPSTWTQYIPWIAGGLAVIVLAPALLQRR